MKTPSRELNRAVRKLMVLKECIYDECLYLPSAVVLPDHLLPPFEGGDEQVVGLPLIRGDRAALVYEVDL